MAQRLNFTNNEPKPGSGAVTAKLASDAREQLEAMDERGIRSVAISAKKAYLSAATLLLQAGEDQGVSGTFLVAAGTRLMRGRDAVFTILDTQGLNDNDVRLLAGDLTLLVEKPPSTQAMLDRALRDAFANVLQAGSSSAPKAMDLWPWPETSDATSPSWPDFAPLGDQATAINVLQTRCELAEKWVVYRPGARAMTRMVMEAAWPIGREKRVQAGAYRRWISELVRAANEFLDEQTAESGLARFQRLALLGRVFSLLDKNTPDPGSKQLEKAIFGAIDIMPDDTATTRGWSKLEQWMELSSKRAALMDDKAVVRQLRPALRSIGDLAKGTQTEMLDALTRVVSKPAASGDPGVMAAVNLYSENIDLLKILHRASDAIDDPTVRGDPVAREDAKPFTEGLLKLSKEVADPKQRDRSLAALRNLATDIAELMELPGEKQLRAQDAKLEKLLGGKSADVLALIDRERATWKKAVGSVVKPGGSSGGEANAARLRAIGIVLSLAMDIGECETLLSDSNNALTQWGGWWLDEAVMRNCVSDASKALPAMIAHAESQEISKVLATVQRSAREHAVVSLAARLSRELVRVRAGATQEVPLRDLRSIATGTPDVRNVQYAPWRERVAIICRYANEAAAGNDDAKRFAATKAAELVEALNTNEDQGR